MRAQVENENLKFSLTKEDPIVNTPEWKDHASLNAGLIGHHADSSFCQSNWPGEVSLILFYNV
jgi:hypothetical protein